MSTGKVSKIEEKALGIYVITVISFLIGSAIYFAVTGGEDPSAFLIFVIAIPTLVITGFLLNIMAGLRILRLLKRFRSAIRIEGQRLILPSVLVVDQGVINIVGKWIEWIDGHVIEYRRRRRYDRKINVSNIVRQTIRAIDLRELCSQPSLIYIDADNNALIEAPGFIISSGEFKDIGVICLDTSNIPKKKIELNIGDYFEAARSIITSMDGYLEVSLKWSSTHVVQEVTYDHKQDISTIISSTTTKPVAPGVTLEICIRTSQETDCKPILKLNKPGESSIGIALLKASKMPIVFYAEGYSYISNSGESSGKRELAFDYIDELITSLKKLAPGHAHKIILGYRPGGISLRLTLGRRDMPGMLKEIVL